MQLRNLFNATSYSKRLQVNPSIIVVPTTYSSMQETLVERIDRLAEPYLKKPLPETLFKAAIERLISDASKPTRRRRHRAAILLCCIKSRVDQATFVFSTIWVRDTVDRLEDAESIIEDLLHWSISRKTEQLSQAAADLCNKHVASLSRLLSLGAIPKMKSRGRSKLSRPSPELIEGSEHSSPDAQTRPDPTEYQNVLVSQDIRELSDFNSGVQRYPESAEGLLGCQARAHEKLTLQTIPEPIDSPDKYQAILALNEIIVPWDHVLAIIGKWDNTVARCMTTCNGKLPRVIVTGFELIRESTTIATIQLSSGVGEDVSVQLQNGQGYNHHTT